MEKENIFIHIPKTGGTTINCAINNTEWQTKPDFNYRHIDYQTKRSNSADIFNPLKNEKYKHHFVFMLLRHPVDRLISEYSFIKDRKEFMSLIKPTATNFKAYIKNKQTNNYMLGFLLGNRMFDTKLVTKDDLDLVLNTINQLDIKVGIFEYYAESLTYFSEFTGLKWKKKIPIKRITLNRPNLKEVSTEIKELIIKHNALDMQLYNFCLERFQEFAKNDAFKKVNFEGNKYDYVLKYTARFNLLEIALDKKDFLRLNIPFFTNLNLYLHKKIKVKKGQDYVSKWNNAFLKAVDLNLKNTELNSLLQKKKEVENSLEETIIIAKIINRVFKKPNNKINNIYKNKLIFNENLVEKTKKFKWF